MGNYFCNSGVRSWIITWASLAHILRCLGIGKIGIHVTVSHGVILGAIGRQTENLPCRVPPDLAIPVKTAQPRY